MSWYTPSIVDRIQDPVEAGEPAFAVPREVYDAGFAHNVSLGYKSPETAVLAVVPVVAHHEIVILLDRIFIPRFPVNSKLIPLPRDGVILKTGKNIFINVIIFGRQRHRLSLKRDHDGGKMMVMYKSRS